MAELAALQQLKSSLEFGAELAAHIIIGNSELS